MWQLLTGLDQRMTRFYYFRPLTKRHCILSEIYLTLKALSIAEKAQLFYSYQNIMVAILLNVYCRYSLKFIAPTGCSNFSVNPSSVFNSNIKVLSDALMQFKCKYSLQILLCVWQPTSLRSFYLILIIESNIQRSYALLLIKLLVVL